MKDGDAKEKLKAEVRHLQSSPSRSGDPVFAPNGTTFLP